MKLTEKAIREMFEEELKNFNFPCPVEIGEGLPDDGNLASGFAFSGNRAMGLTYTKMTFRKDIPDELLKVSFYPASFIHNCEEDLKGRVPEVAKNIIMFLATKTGIGVSEKIMRYNVYTTIAHEYRHCLQFRYMIENGLDMASYQKEEKWGVYGCGLLESDAIEYSKGNIVPIETVFANKKYYKRNWTYLEAMFM